jgi:ribosomal protein S11
MMYMYQRDPHKPLNTNDYSAKYAAEEAARKREEEVEEAIAWRDVHQYMAAFGLPKSKESLQRCLPHPTTESATLQSRTAFEESRIRAEQYVWSCCCGRSCLQCSSREM